MNSDGTSKSRTSRWTGRGDVTEVKSPLGVTQLKARDGGKVGIDMKIGDGVRGDRARRQSKGQRPD